MVFILMACVALAQDPQPLAKFGTTVVIPTGLRGQVYHLHRWTSRLPDFAKMRPRGTIYTSELDIPVQDFQQGFPGVTKKFEWFAIEYTGRFWIEKAGEYTFSLLSDDGANLYIDAALAVDNDGMHPPAEKTGKVKLAKGVHRIRVSYFQGPRFQVALVLKVAGPGERMRVFSTDEFKPPPNPENWQDPDSR